MIDVGVSVGNYIVKSKLGEGGMGIVWLAEHPLIGKRVAIKVIHPSYARNPEAVSRFFTEAQAVNRVGHPNIVDITDFGQSPAGESYFVMEFLSGQSLAQRMQGDGLDLRRAVHVAAQDPALLRRALAPLQGQPGLRLSRVDANLEDVFISLIARAAAPTPAVRP